MQLVWDQDGQRFYETGNEKTALYLKGSTVTPGESPYQNGVAWNGVTGVTQSPSGADESAIYADDIKYLSLRAREELGGTITAYTYPDEWAACDGSAMITDANAKIKLGQQTRKTFGLVHVTKVGNDQDFDDHGYKIHLLYGCTASPSERAYATINESPEAIEFSWEFTTTPVEVGEINGVKYKPASIITIDSRDYTTEESKRGLKKLEDALFGTATTNPYMPLPAEVMTLLKDTTANPAG